jgi:hypothetical protein
MAITVPPEVLRMRLYAFREAQLRARAAGPEPEPTTPLEWARAFRRPDGNPFTLDRFRPVQALYKDDHPHIVVIKPSQRGVSEYAINLAFFALEWGARRWADHKDGLNVAYIFPTKTALSDFSKERISGMKRESAHMLALLGSAEYNDVTFKQFGGSFLYLRGGWSEEALESFPADVLILDEYDRLDPKAISLAQKRLNASEIGREVDISTPSVPGYGIHRSWLESDQRIYEQPCPHCAAWNRYEFMTDVYCDGEPRVTGNKPEDGWSVWPTEEILKSKVTLRCPRCKRDVEDEGRLAEGRWRPLEPSIRGKRGYWIPALAFPYVSLQKLAVASVSEIPAEIETFWRGDMGQPYDAKGSRVTEEMLLKLSAEMAGGRLPETGWSDTTMGVDIGARLHYRISSRADSDGYVYTRVMGAVSTWPELDVLMEQFRVRSCVVDALPEIHDAFEFSQRFPGRVLRAQYPTRHNFAGKRFDVKQDEGIVNINRVAMMDAVYASIATGRERWPKSVIEAAEVKLHMTAPVRVTHDNAAGQAVPDWVHAAPDHLYHACVYDMVARMAGQPEGPPGILAQGSAKGW